MTSYEPTKSEAPDVTVESKTNNDFNAMEPKTAEGTQDLTPSSSEYKKIGKTWPDLVYPFTDKIRGNIYIVVATLIFIFAIVSGNLKNKNDFFWVFLSVIILCLIIFLYNRFKK
jgi:hypothetical protein